MDSNKPTFDAANDDGPSMTVTEFCRLEKISRPFYQKLRAAGRGPHETHLLGKVVIQPKHRREWREAQNNLSGEQLQQQIAIDESIVKRGRELGATNKRRAEGRNQ